MSITPQALSNQVRHLKPAQLRLMAELADGAALGLAADRIGVSQPAASRLLAEIEALLGLTLRERRGRGIALTAAGEALARRAARVQIELLDAARELAEAASGRAGVVRVGSVTGPALSLVLPCLTDLQRQNPDFRAEVSVLPSAQLCDQLRAGKLDFALARLMPGETMLEARHLTGEPLALVVRRGHPLVAAPNPTPADLMRFDWVMGDDESLLAQTVTARLAALRLPMPNRRISTASFLFTLALLSQTDAIAPLAASVADSFAGQPSMPFLALPIDLGLEVAPFSLITRKGAQLTPAALRLAGAVEAKVLAG